MEDHKQGVSKRNSKKTKWKRRNIRVQKAHSEVKQIKEIQDELNNIDTENVTDFSHLPISKKTQLGLKSSGYITMTDIQKQGITCALRGCDVLGAAKTGSGKTLAFLIPVLECLWKQRFSSVDGLGALIISPTRELAYQTFEVLRKIGKYHDISAGLIIGGKELSFEQQRIQKTNIIVCTPGRLLQHMDETPNFDCSNLKILVLDEADRILDMGFRETINGVIENLPDERQTLLFSATQTSSVSDLARLSLHDPEYVSVHEKSSSSTPQELKQSYVVCALEDKMNFLYSFIKNHLKNKVLVFLSSCKQVKFTYEIFRRLRPGLPLMALYGKQNQVKRVAIYNDFCRKTSAVLFATDIAARGLDFPAIHWVVQFDCPEDASTYIHRAGRTARYQSGGHALLMLLPSEKPAMVKELETKKVPISEIEANPKKLLNIQKKLEGLCVQDQNIKQWAQKSIVSYVRSVFLQSNKSVFNVKKLPIEKYAISLGLLQAPRIRFLQKAEKKRGKEEETSDEILKLQLEERLETTTSDQDFLVLRTRNVEIPSDSDNDEINNDTEKNRGKSKGKISSAKTSLKKSIKMNNKIKFDEDGGVLQSPSNDTDGLSNIDDRLSSTDDIACGGLNLEESSIKLRAQDRVDKEEFRNKVKQKHREKRRKEKQNNKRGFDETEEQISLNNASEEDEGEYEGSRVKKAKYEKPEDEQVDGDKTKEEVNGEETEEEMNRRTLMKDEELVLELLQA